jgi:SSS family solute:Na+ symporter
MTTTERNLGVISLTTLLVSSHYGLGFIVGTAEKSFVNGPRGSLYAVAVGLGMMALSLLARFYWTRIDPLWTILGDRYGYPVKLGIGVMSWISLIGIEAVQIISAAAILGIVGFPETVIMPVIAGVFCGLALLPIEKASGLFRALLLINILVLVGALWRIDHGQAYGHAILEFVPTVSQGMATEMVGVAISTVLLVLIDMKCQQFVVRSQSIAIAGWSCILSGAIFIGLAFLPTSLIIAAQQSALLPDSVTGKTAIPYLLSWLGGGIQTPLGAMFVASLALPALGLGSNVLRIQTKANFDILNLSGGWGYQLGFSMLNAVLALLVALNGGEIVRLIVLFYAAYLSAIWIPFMGYLLEHAQVIVFSTLSIQFALIAGGAASLTTLGLTLVKPEFVLFQSSELTILGMGMGASLVTLMGIQAVEMVGMVLKRPQKDLEV